MDENATLLKTIATAIVKTHALLSEDNKDILYKPTNSKEFNDVNGMIDLVIQKRMTDKLETKGVSNVK